MRANLGVFTSLSQLDPLVYLTFRYPLPFRESQGDISAPFFHVLCLCTLQQQYLLGPFHSNTSPPSNNFRALSLWS